MQKTKGESTSLPIDATKSLMASLVYTLDIYLEKMENPDEAVTLLKETPISQLIQRGTDIIRKQYDEIKEMYIYLVKNKLDVPLECYHTTVDVAVPTFLKSYNMIFAAQVTATTIDYPLAKDDWDVCGVKYMYTYMKRILLETRFCKKFGDKLVEELLECFGKALHVDYKLELINMFELMYHNALFLQLAGLESSKLIFSEEERIKLIQNMSKWNRNQIDMRLKNGTNDLIEALHITDSMTIQYMYDYLPNLIKRTKNALQNNSIESLILAQSKEVEKAKSIIFQCAESMDSRAFRKLLQELADRYDKDEKAKYIITHIQSVYDLIDILNSDVLYGDEYGALFSKFGDFELAILIKIIYYEEMRDSQERLSHVIASVDWFDYEWKEQFSRYMQNVKEERMKNVEKLLNDIDYEQLK